MNEKLENSQPDHKEQKEVDLFLKKLRFLKREGGWGKIIVTVHNSKVVYAIVEIGEQVAMDIDTR
jgi:hypothetical protein